MIRLVLALLALVGLMWLASWLGKVSPAQRSKALKMILLYGVAGVLLLLVVTGANSLDVRSSQCGTSLATTSINGTAGMADV